MMMVTLLLFQEQRDMQVIGFLLVQTLQLIKVIEIDAGAVPFAKVQSETTKTKDITGGLPRVAELI